ncbi:MAG: cysteine desulfurase family protein [archaeon]|nr:cysteine desulfurase family protein [archaeon]
MTFDYISGCPIDERVIEAMAPHMREPGNPSSVHSHGFKAKQILEESRASVAALVNADQNEIVFTSGATESNNLALIGYALRNREKGNHIITSAVEHMSVINPCKFLQKNGFEISYAPVDRYGVVDPSFIEESVKEDTLLISVQHANNEIGTIQPIEELGKTARERGVALHVDATASLGKIEVNVEKLNVDLLTLSSNDIYGPRGVGALYVRKGTKVQPLLLGGGQERGLRSGTEDVACIVGFGAAAEITRKEYVDEAARLTKMRDKLIDRILKIEESYLNGHPEKRLPNNVNVRFSYIEGESIVLSLDQEGIQASTGSACSSKTLQPSHVLTAMGLKHEEAHGSLLLTLGRLNEDEDVEKLLGVLPSAVERLRMISPLYRR